MGGFTSLRLICTSLAAEDTVAYSIAFTNQDVLSPSVALVNSETGTPVDQEQPLYVRAQITADGWGPVDDTNPVSSALCNAGGSRLTTPGLGGGGEVQALAVALFNSDAEQIDAFGEQYEHGDSATGAKGNPILLDVEGTLAAIGPTNPLPVNLSLTPLPFDAIDHSLPVGLVNRDGDQIDPAGLDTIGWADRAALLPVGISDLLGTHINPARSYASDNGGYHGVPTLFYDGVSDLFVPSPANPFPIGIYDDADTQLGTTTNPLNIQLWADNGGSPVKLKGTSDGFLRVIVETP